MDLIMLTISFIIVSVLLYVINSIIKFSTTGKRTRRYEIWIRKKLKRKKRREK